MTHCSQREELIEAMSEECRLCGNRCGTNRRRGEPTLCEAGPLAEIARVVVHHGEEPPISGSRGCGNIFFAHCSLRCVFCQNWQISNERAVPFTAVTSSELAGEMLRLQEREVHTIGLVSPTPHLTTIVPALESARRSGLTLPVVWNSGGFDSQEALRLLDGLIDIYLPDMKYGSDEPARIYSGVKDYVSTSRQALLEMHRQVGPLQLDDEGIARRGLLVRHLILPGGMADTDEVLSWLARNLPREVPLSLMSQYLPSYQVPRGLYPELARTLTRQEYEYYLAVAEGLGLTNLFVQELESAAVYFPDFSKDRPFSPDSSEPN